MRTPQHDPGIAPSIAPAAQKAGEQPPERRCILTGEHGARTALLRLAIAPDGMIVPDIAAKAPGRGAWIAVDRSALSTAMANGKLKGALARAHKGGALTFPVDLPEQIDTAFRRALLAQLGLAAKSGALLTGADKVDAAARSGQVFLLCHAADAAEDGRRKRDQSWRVGSDEEGSGKRGRVLPIDRTALSVALGRDNAVHIAIIDHGWAARTGKLIDRWLYFAGPAGHENADVAHAVVKED